mmetsp:Transcript_37816/g.119286  ORF Transcript_37816/g.119286 Transcript_37816/m.119286 type:complete len:281 (-) Transcript_37816:1116-1958(-)
MVPAFALPRGLARPLDPLLNRLLGKPLVVQLPLHRFVPGEDVQSLLQQLELLLRLLGRFAALLLALVRVAFERPLLVLLFDLHRARHLGNSEDLVVVRPLLPLDIEQRLLVRRVYLWILRGQQPEEILDTRERLLVAAEGAQALRPGEICRLGVLPVVDGLGAVVQGLLVLLEPKEGGRAFAEHRHDEGRPRGGLAPHWLGAHCCDGVMEAGRGLSKLALVLGRPRRREVAVHLADQLEQLLRPRQVWLLAEGLPHMRDRLAHVAAEVQRAAPHYVRLSE